MINIVMTTITVITLLVFIYIFITFFLTRIFIPLLGFKAIRIPKIIPKSMEKAIFRIKNRSRNKHQFLINTHKYLRRRFHGEMTKTITEMHLLWKPLEFIWNKKGFVHCCWHNFILKIFLVKSGFFKSREVKLVHPTANLFIHQYAKVKTGRKKWIPVDLFNYKYGCELGKKHNRWA